MVQQPLPEAMEAGGGHEAGVPAVVEEAKVEEARARTKAKEKVRIKEKVKEKAAALEAGPTEDGLGKVAKDPKDVNLVRLDIGTADGARTAKEKEKEKIKAKEERRAKAKRAMEKEVKAKAKRAMTRRKVKVKRAVARKEKEKKPRLFHPDLNRSDRMYLRTYRLKPQCSHTVKIS